VALVTDDTVAASSTSLVTAGSTAAPHAGQKAARSGMDPPHDAQNGTSEFYAGSYPLPAFRFPLPASSFPL
jgi:hypothetical protein